MMSADAIEKKELLSTDSFAADVDESSSPAMKQQRSGRRNVLWTLAVPFLCLILGILVDTHFLPALVLFLLHAVKPVLYYMSKFHPLPSGLMRRLVVQPSAAASADEQQQFQQSVLDDMVTYTLQMHRSMVIQLTILVGFLMVYHTTQQNCGKNVHQAYRNAASIISTEHALGIDFEPKLQQWLLPHTIISKFFDHYYAIMHFSVTAWTGTSGRWPASLC
jgi:hypothetical protein